MWISPKFKLLLIKEFERLKAEEQKQIGWNAKRELSKINYRIHTDAIKNNLIPKELSKNQINFVYAEEADVLNMALFGMTAKEWRTNNPDLDGNIRDYVTMNELLCLANLENLNSMFIQKTFGGVSFWRSITEAIRRRISVSRISTLPSLTWLRKWSRLIFSTA